MTQNIKNDIFYYVCGLLNPVQMIHVSTPRHILLKQSAKDLFKSSKNDVRSEHKTTITITGTLVGRIDLAKKLNHFHPQRSSFRVGTCSVDQERSLISCYVNLAPLMRRKNI